MWKSFWFNISDPLAKKLMKLICKQTELSTVLAMVNRAVSPNNTLPVLNNILLKAEGKKLYLSATNLEISISASIDAKVENEGRLTVPAKAITSYVSLLKDDEVKLEVQNGNTLELISTDSDTKIKGISGDEFPNLPTLTDPKSFTLPTPNLREAIEQVVFAASTNISRPVLTGVLWKISGQTMKLVATDSYRLAEKTLKLDVDTGAEIDLIVPARTCHELAKILASHDEKAIAIQVAKGQAIFDIGSVTLTSRLIEGNFPDYEKILPAENKSEAELLTEDFLLALKKISVIVRENNNNVRVQLEGGKVKVYSEETQLGNGVVDLPTTVKGENAEAALNAQYLLEVLSNLKDEKVKFGLNDALSPVKVVPADEGSGYLHIIMPLKI